MWGKDNTQVAVSRQFGKTAAVLRGKRLAESLAHAALVLTRIGVLVIFTLPLALACLPAETPKPELILVTHRISQLPGYDCTGRDCEELGLGHALSTGIQSDAPTYSEGKIIATGNKPTFPRHKRARITVNDFAARCTEHQELDVRGPNEHETGIRFRSPLRPNTFHVTSLRNSCSAKDCL